MSVLGLILAGTMTAANALYPWSVEVKGVVSKETGHPPRAYLWLPNQERTSQSTNRRIDESSKSPRAIVLGMHNMLEEPIFRHPEFRRILAEHNIGICWVTPMLPQKWDELSESEIAAIEQIFIDFDSRYALSTKHSALIPLGHSAMATYPYLLAAARPERVKRAISLKGDWPCPGRPCWESAQQAARQGAKLLLVSGEYEDGYHRKELSKALTDAVPGADFTCMIDDGGGHFDWSDELCVKLAKWICGEYDGVPFVRGERGKGKKFTVLGVAKNSSKGDAVETYPQDPKAHLQVIFTVDASEFEVRPVFEKVVPPGRPENWTGLKAGSANPRPADPAAESRLEVENIDGPIEKIGRNRFRVSNTLYDPAGRRVRSAAFQIVYPGDGEFKRSVQQFEVRLP